MKKKTKYYCQCGCGEEVSVFRGKPRRYIIGHGTRSPQNRKMHSERMKGNNLFKGGKMPKSAKEAIAKSQTGSNNSFWNGGRTISHGGYVSILKPKHPFVDVNGRVKEERLVMEKYIGRYIQPEETVHHINKIKTDNRIENLALMTKHNHLRYHALIRWYGDTKIDYREFSIAFTHRS